HISPSSSLPPHAHAQCARKPVACTKIGKTGAGGSLAIERVLVVVPVERAADTDLAPQPFAAAGEADAIQRHREAIAELTVEVGDAIKVGARDRKSTRLNSSHVKISYAVFCLKK